MESTTDTKKLKETMKRERVFLFMVGVILEFD